MSTYKQKTLRTLAVALLAMGMAAPAVQADDDKGGGWFGGKRDRGHGAKYGGENRGKPLQPAQSNTKFQQECSACHIAHAPGLLPAASWRKMMAELDQHFGLDASLDDADNKEITAFLVSNASNRWSASTAPLRISEAAWFKHEHDDHEIDPAIWKNPLVQGASNCGACHTQAESGDFSERNIKIPRQ